MLHLPEPLSATQRQWCGCSALREAGSGPCPGRVGLSNSGNKGLLLGHYGAEAPPESTATHAKCSPSPGGCCAHVHGLGTGSILAPRDKLLPGGTRRNAKPWHGGRQRGVLREAVTAVLSFLPRGCLHALDRRNAPCQALRASALPLKACALAGGTVSRGFAQLSASAPFPNYFHAFQSGLAPRSFPPAASSPTAHLPTPCARGTLCPHHHSRARGASPGEPTLARTWWAASQEGERWAKTHQRCDPSPCLAQCACPTLHRGQQRALDMAGKVPGSFMELRGRDAVAMPMQCPWAHPSSLALLAAWAPHSTQPRPCRTRCSGSQVSITSSVVSSPSTDSVRSYVASARHRESPVDTALPGH